MPVPVGTVSIPAPYPVPLEQLNLKLPPEVLADWRARASAEGCSVRDWLLVITGSQARPKADLEARVEALETALAALQSHRSPAPAEPRPQPPALHTEAGVAPPAGAVTSRELAELLKVDPSAPNKWASKYGPGEVWRGWRLLGRSTEPTRNGQPPWLWVPAAT